VVLTFYSEVIWDTNEIVKKSRKDEDLFKEFSGVRAISGEKKFRAEIKKREKRF
jgi:hypothetical protein